MLRMEIVRVLEWQGGARDPGNTTLSVTGRGHSLDDLFAPAAPLPSPSQ
jgi:hypothetical protein